MFITGEACRRSEESTETLEPLWKLHAAMPGNGRRSRKQDRAAPENEPLNLTHLLCKEVPRSPLPSMPDYYEVPALVLTALLLPAFGYLYLRFRDTRTLLWFLGFLCAVFRMLLLYRLGSWDFADGNHPWLAAAGQCSIQVGSALFLASLSPLGFRLGRLKVLYVIPYTIPMVVYSILFHGVFRGVVPAIPAWRFCFAVLVILALIVACRWSVAKGSMPPWLGLLGCILAGYTALWAYFTHGPLWPLTFAECGNDVMTATLLIFVFRRLTPGVVLSALGFLAWACSFLFILPALAHNPALNLTLTRLVVMGKVVAAVGMILLALEDELAANQTAKLREYRARKELEAYANLILSRRRVEDFDRQGAEICQTVVTHSRFSQAALLLLRGTGRYRLAGSAGLNDATVAALDQLATRIPMPGFLARGTAPAAVPHSHAMNLSLEPWLNPGDDLKRLHFTSVLAVPMQGRTSTEGALLLSAMRRPAEPLRTDDLLPVEMLTARLQAVRSHTTMLEKLIDSEKYAGLGQLAGSVTQQLNNPLTVILGYASLLEEAHTLENHERKGVEAILTEARRMRATLESLSRTSRSQDGQFTSVSVSELLADMETLYGAEFLRRSIAFHLHIGLNLPNVVGDAQQLRQALLHCLQFCLEAVESMGASHEEKTIRLDASHEGKRVQILVAHSGPPFLHPERAFDPFVPTQAMGETAGLGLSLCATILRDHHGRISAVNLEPRGAAIVLELVAE
jgi:signal transduction histidine kinase